MTVMIDHWWAYHVVLAGPHPPPPVIAMPGGSTGPVLAPPTGYYSVAVTWQVVSRLPCTQLSDSLTYQIHITIFGNSLRHS